MTQDDVAAVEDRISERYGLEKHSLPMLSMAPWIALCDELPDEETFQRMLDYTKRGYLWMNWVLMVGARLELRHVDEYVVAFYVAANRVFILDEVREYVRQNLSRFPRYQRLELEKPEEPEEPRSSDDEIHFPRTGPPARIRRLGPPPPGPISRELYILLRRWESYRVPERPRLVEISDRQELTAIPTDYFLELFEKYQRRPEPLEGVPPYPDRKLYDWQAVVRHPSVIWAVDELAPSFPPQTGDLFPAAALTEEWDAFRRKDGE